ncbi:LytTR family DNA-binding domain-containing protein [Flavobacteriaceae bacterium]|jgi:DNA-binding LytR/AlgR family response regulator|nr:LytTR family DNA-binding domain-containing protein [Flavobacteriaceae bacterium]MDC3285940.1 LytTR family DNA-binding domain-containing protein [Flavobacteriaceae bacterium]
MSDKVTCMIVDDEPMAREIISSFVGKIHNLELVATCKNVSEAFSVLQKESIQLIFLDINMPEISGLSLAKSIQHKSQVIFTTAYREYAIEGFDLQAVDYLLKPISFDRFLKAVQKYFDLHASKEIIKQEIVSEAKETSIFVRSDRKMVKVRFKEINYIESLSDYVKIFTDKETIITRETISNIESKLPSNEFLRTHRSYIVSMPKIDSFTNEFLELDKKAIPISRSYKENVLQKLAGK